MIEEYVDQVIAEMKVVRSMLRHTTTYSMKFRKSDRQFTVSDEFIYRHGDWDEYLRTMIRHMVVRELENNPF